MIGKNIRYYRLMCGLSQEALAESLGLNKMAISNYEKDKRTPGMDTIRKIAGTLGISVGNLLSGNDPEPEIIHGAFRKTAHIPKSGQEVIFATLDRYLAKVFTVAAILGDGVLGDIPTYEKIPARDRDAAGLYLRHILGLPESGPAGNITNILENKGFIICPINTEDARFSGNSGFVAGRPYIAVNTNMSAERQRFTLIHELAHLVFTFTKEQDEEAMVDDIAGAFLFPEEDVKRELGPKRNDIRSDLRLLQKEYNISVVSIVTRAKQCGIITQATFENMKKWINSQGAQADTAETEVSHLLERITLRAVSEDEISFSRAAELLEMPITEIRTLCYGGA